MQPAVDIGDLAFTLKDISYTPEAPRMKAPFTVSGKVELLKVPFLAPIWVIVKVTYPEKFWEEIIPVIGSPTVTEADMVIGGDFDITFRKGFDREGEFLLDVEAYAGPTFSLNKVKLPPFPPVASYQTTFLVAGEVPPEELGFRNFKIVSYSKNAGPPVTPPGVLELDIGDRCRVNVGLDHRNGAVTGKYYAAIGNLHHVPVEWLDEVLHADKAFSLPPSADWQPFEDYIDIPITSAISPGSYSMYVKIMGITGGDIFTEYLENVITIVGVPPPEEADIADFDFKLTKGTYDVGAKVSFTAPYKYKGVAQDGQLTISIGTGIIPTFNPVYSYEPIPVSFEAAVDWALGSIEGNITLPDLEAGQTYSVRAKLETLTVKTQETDTDWSAFDITPGPPASDIADWDLTATKGTYDLGARVAYDASYKYKGKAQGGYLTISLGTGIYPSFITRHTFPPVSVSFEEAYEWTPGQLSGDFTLPTTLEPGQTYSVRAKLETADGVSEIDTDWSAFDITPAPPASDLALPDPGFEATPGTYDLGDSVPWTMLYEYKGKAQGGYLTISLGTGVYPSFFTKHTFPKVAVSFEEAMDWAPGELSGSFTLPTTLEPGETYSVRAKLETADGVSEIDTDWGVFDITPAPPPPPKADIADFDLRAEGGTYDIGDRVPFSATYKYKGIKQSGQLVLELGTGIYPTFSPVVRYSPMPVAFDEAMDWESRSLEGSFVLTEALEPGRTYSVRAKLETLTDKTQETDTDWGVITIEAVAPPPPPPEYYTLTIDISPWGAGSVTGEGEYEKGTYAAIEAIPGVDYEFDRWGGDASGTARYIRVYMSRDKSVVAYFKEKVERLYLLTTKASPIATGRIFKDPNKTRYSYGELVTLTASPYSGHRFSYWTKDGAYLSSYSPVTTAILGDHVIVAYFERA